MIYVSFEQIFAFVIIYTSIIGYIGYWLKKIRLPQATLYPLFKVEAKDIELTDWTAITTCAVCYQWKLIVATEINGVFGWICNRCLF